MARDYKDEYEKFQKDKSAYRAKLNKYNRDKGTYGNGDGKDASHNNGKITGFEDSSENKGKKEKSRLEGSERKNYQDGGLIKGKSHEAGGEVIEVEGNEIVINEGVNGAASMHAEGLLALNENPEAYEIRSIPNNGLAASGGLVERDSVNAGTLDTLEYINRHGNLPLSDARDRGKKY